MPATHQSQFAMMVLMMTMTMKSTVMTEIAGEDSLRGTEVVWGMDYVRDRRARQRRWFALALHGLYGTLFFWRRRSAVALTVLIAFSIGGNQQAFAETDSLPLDRYETLPGYDQHIGNVETGKLLEHLQFGYGFGLYLRQRIDLDLFTGRCGRRCQSKRPQ